MKLIRNMNLHLLLAGLGLCLVVAGPAAAQSTGFEPSDGYNAGDNVDGDTDAQLGGPWYLPNGPSQDDHMIVDSYAGGVLGLATNPNGASQFIGGKNLGDGNFNRAQLNYPFAAGGVYTVSYDICVSHMAGMAVKDNISSWSLQPSDTNTAYFILLNAWHHQALADPNGRWTAALEVFDSSGNGPLIGIVKGKPARELLQNHWYTHSVTFDLTANQVTSLTYTNIKKGLSGTAMPTIFYLQGGSAGGLATPSAFRFFVGGGTGTNGGNICGFDNLSVSAGPAPAPANAIPLRTALVPLKKSMATAASN